MNRSKLSRLRSLVNKLFNNREMSVYEAALKAMQIAYILTNVTVEDITLGRKCDRSRKLKSAKKLAELSDDSEDMFEMNFLDYYYVYRPPVLEDKSVYAMKSQYTYAKGKASANARNECHDFDFKDDSGNLVQMHLVSPSYVPSTGDENGKKKFIFNMIQLYRPWRKESDIVPDDCISLEEHIKWFEKCMAECPELKANL